MMNCASPCYPWFLIYSPSGFTCLVVVMEKSFNISANPTIKVLGWETVSDKFCLLHLDLALRC